jgi:hypothetical protein
MLVKAGLGFNHHLDELIDRKVARHAANKGCTDLEFELALFFGGQRINRHVCRRVDDMTFSRH